MNGLYKGPPAPRGFHKNYDQMAQAIENGPKNSQAVVVKFSGGNGCLDRLTPQEQAALREFDRTLFLSLTAPLMALYDDTAPYEAPSTARKRREEFRTTALPYCALAMAKVINPYLVEALLDPRPMAHHHQLAGSRWTSVSRLQDCVEKSIRRIVEAHYTAVDQFKVDGLPASAVTLKRLQRMKAAGVRAAVLHKLNTTNWIAKNGPQVDAA